MGKIEYLSCDYTSEIVHNNKFRRTLMENNLIEFELYGGYKFVMIPHWIDWVTMRNGKVIKKQFALIGIKDISRGVYIIHPITEFILSKWGLRKYNSQRKHVNNTVRFLNYLLKYKRKLSLANLSDLEVSHASEYLNSMTAEGMTRGTVKDSERTITYFYLWLIDNHAITKVPKHSFIKKETVHGTHYYLSPFKVSYPVETNPNIEHCFPTKYIPLLFEIATLETKPIALGLYFQLFGGLRVGEVVNLKRTQVKRRIVNGDFLFDIKDQNFRTDINESSGGSSVKRSRYQRVFQIKDWGEILYKDHISLYRDTDNTNALFVNRNGKAMSGKSYRQYFDKLKNCFITYLKLYGDVEDKLVAHHLNSVSWSTHIGRGTFTNILAEEAENPYDIAFPRGDKNLLSSLSYMSRTERIRKKIEQKFNNMQDIYIPRLIERSKKIDND